MVMVPKETYQMRWNVNGAKAAVDLFVVDGADDLVLCFLDYGAYNVQIKRNGQKVYYTFN